MGGSEEEEEEENQSEEEEEEEEELQNREISEYEKKRLERIEENKARLKALGLPALASSFVATKPKNKSEKKAKRKLHHRGEGTDDDDEYRPSDEGEAEEDREISSDTEEEDIGVIARLPSSSSKSRRRKETKKKSTSHAAKIGKRLHGKQLLKESDDIDDDTALQQAIALSLGGATEQTVNDGASRNCGINGACSSSCVKKDRGNLQETSGRKNIKKVNKSRVQLTEDEVIAFFFSFDVAGKGHITTRDLHRMVIAHDFTWTEMEMEHMIHCFDDDKDERLTLEDFRSIIIRCKMLQEPGKC